MVMTAQEGLDGIGTHGVGKVETVIDIVREHRHVAHEKHGFAVGTVAPKLVFYPFYILGGHVAQGHTHERTAREAQEQPAVVLKLKALIAKNMFEIHTSALAPLLVMVALKYVVRLSRSEEHTSELQSRQYLV